MCQDCDGNSTKLPIGISGNNGTNGTNGTNGLNGTNGINGNSAYQVAVANGFVGTISQWLTSLIGPTGAGFVYTSYIALLNQVGGAAPAATIIYNTLSGSIVWSRIAPGIYQGVLVGAFTLNKTFITINEASPTAGSYAQLFYSDVNTLVLFTYDNTNIHVDSVLFGNSLEVRVYP